MVGEGGVGLAEAVRSLRAEIVDAMRAGAEEEIRFGLGPIDLELQVEVSREGTAKAGVQFWVVSVGADVAARARSTHTVRLTLTPVRRDQAGPDDLLIASDLEAR